MTADRHRRSRRGSSRTACPTSSTEERAAAPCRAATAPPGAPWRVVLRRCSPPAWRAAAPGPPTRRTPSARRSGSRLRCSRCSGTPRPPCTRDRSWGSPCHGPSAACASWCRMASRALPLLLVFVTFLFVNAEAWQMTTNLAVRAAVVHRPADVRPGGAVPARAAARGGRPASTTRWTTTSSCAPAPGRRSSRPAARSPRTRGSTRRTTRRSPASSAGTSSSCCWSSRPCRCCCSR